MHNIVHGSGEVPCLLVTMKTRKENLLLFCTGTESANQALVASGKCSFSITFFRVFLRFEVLRNAKTRNAIFFSSTSKNNNYVFRIYTRYQGLLLHICSDLVSN